MALKEYKKFKKQENIHFTILLLYNIKRVVGGGGIVHKDNRSDINTSADIGRLTFFWMVMFSLASSSCDS